MRIFLVSVSLLALTGCRGPGDAPSESAAESVAPDSAGVEIISMSDSREAEQVTLGEPLSRVGWSGGDPPFQALRHGRLLPDGSALVVDVIARRIYHLSDQLELVDSVGGPGEGPGEFESIARIAAISSDSIVAYDLTSNRVTTFFDTAVATRQMAEDRAAVFHAPSGVMADGRVFWGIYGATPYKLQSEGPLRAAVLVGDARGEALDTLASVDFVDIVRVGSRLQPRPMGTEGLTATTPEGFVWASNGLPEIRWFSAEGELFRILRWIEKAEALDDEYWEDFVEAQVVTFTTDVGSPLPEEFVRDRYAGWEPVLPETLPLFRQPEFGSDGSIWLRRRPPLGEEESAYLVISPDGRCLRNLLPPARFTFMDSRDGRVLGIELNELDVPSAVLYRLQPCAP